MYIFENSVDPDQLALSEASAVFHRANDYSVINTLLMRLKYLE